MGSDYTKLEQYKGLSEQSLEAFEKFEYGRGNIHLKNYKKCNYPWLKAHYFRKLDIQGGFNNGVDFRETSRTIRIAVLDFFIYVLQRDNHVRFPVFTGSHPRDRVRLATIMKEIIAECKTKRDIDLTEDFSRLFGIDFPKWLQSPEKYDDIPIEVSKYLNSWSVWLRDYFKKGAKMD